MPEMPPAGEDHRSAGSLHYRGHLIVPFGAARLDDRGDPGRERELGAVGEWEERFRREDGAVEFVLELPRLGERDLDRVDAALLAGADPDRLESPCDHDRVRADVLAGAPREQKIAPLLFRRLAAYDLHRLAVLDVPVAILDQQPAWNAFVVALAGAVRAPFVVDEDSRVRLRLQRRD